MKPNCAEPNRTEPQHRFLTSATEPTLPEFGFLLTDQNRTAATLHVRRHLKNYKMWETLRRTTFFAVCKRWRACQKLCQTCAERTMLMFLLFTSSTAQGGGGTFKNRKPIGGLVVVNHGWQSEPTDGPEGRWSCVFWSGCSGQLTHNCWI